MVRENFIYNVSPEGTAERVGRQDICVQEECTQDFILGHSQPSRRDWIVFFNPTQDFILGYFQPSLRD
jgi:hypothetical protein